MIGSPSRSISVKKRVQTRSMKKLSQPEKIQVTAYAESFKKVRVQNMTGFPLIKKVLDAHKIKMKSRCT
jgi:hypothetical protein